jgi:hypothetical protein
VRLLWVKLFLLIERQTAYFGAFFSIICNLMALTKQDVESELSYAYLHAVAGKAGMSCKLGNRYDDGAGVDAEVIYRGPTLHPYFTMVQLDVQLKATIKSPGNDPNFMSYFIQGVERYEKLRVRDGANHRIVVVLFLPQNPNDWLNCSPNDLILKNAAYWTCLHGAKASANATGETIYLPRTNLLTPQALTNLAMMASNNTVPNYTHP